jgi:hypothetical protein
VATACEYPRTGVGSVSEFPSICKNGIESL